jgi:hypothetical protein
MSEKIEDDILLVCGRVAYRHYQLQDISFSQNYKLGRGRTASSLLALTEDLVRASTVLKPIIAVNHLT